MLSSNLQNKSYRESEARGQVAPLRPRDACPLAVEVNLGGGASDTGPRDSHGVLLLVWGVLGDATSRLVREGRRLARGEGEGRVFVRLKRGQRGPCAGRPRTSSGKKH